METHKEMNVALLIASFSLDSILLPSTFKRIKVYRMQGAEGKLNSRLFVP
jgi:hypothetical protein